MGPSVRVITNTSFATKKQNYTHEWGVVSLSNRHCATDQKRLFSSNSGENHNDFKTTLLRVCNTFLRFDWLNRAQTTEYSWQCVPVPAVTSPQGGGGLAHSSWCRFWLGKTKTKNRGWESWLGALLWKSQLSGHSFAHIISKPTQTQRPTKTVYRSGPEYYAQLLFTAIRFDQNGYNRLYFAKPASKILAVVACSAILTYVTLVS